MRVPRVAGAPDVTDTLFLPVGIEFWLPDDSNVPEREGVGRRFSLGGERLRW